MKAVFSSSDVHESTELSFAFKDDSLEVAVYDVNDEQSYNSITISVDETRELIKFLTDKIKS